MTDRHLFVPIASVVKTTTADGTHPARVVKGLMSDETLDLDGQIADYGWLKSEATKWLAAWGNIREQHSARAIGKGVDIRFNDAERSAILTSKIVDRDAIMKIDERVLSGYSIGVKGARVINDEKAPNGRITGGTLIEVSLVDHPANENCKVVVAAKGTGVSPAAAALSVGEMGSRGAEVPQFDSLVEAFEYDLRTDPLYAAHIQRRVAQTFNPRGTRSKAAKLDAGVGLDLVKTVMKIQASGLSAVQQQSAIAAEVRRLRAAGLLPV